jgi:hypothetical protein
MGGVRVDGNDWNRRLGKIYLAKLPLRMPSVVEQFVADSRFLDRTYPLVISQARMARLEKFDHNELALLAGMNFDSLTESDKID